MGKLGPTLYIYMYTVNIDKQISKKSFVFIGEQESVSKLVHVLINIICVSILCLCKILLTLYPKFYSVRAT